MWSLFKYCTEARLVCWTEHLTAYGAMIDLEPGKAAPVMKEGPGIHFID